jgi:hypothetical protein
MTIKDVRRLEPRRIDDRTLLRLRNAIIENTIGDECFWLGEILLAVLKEETGFDGSKVQQ